MCGIVAYLGDKDAYEIIIKGLKRLEYRGYDSSGVGLHNGKCVNIYKYCILNGYNCFFFVNSFSE